MAPVRGVIRAGWEGMNRYRSMGFTSANIGRDNQPIIAIEAIDKSPSYSWTCGVVYIVVGTVKNLAAGSLSARLKLWHELFHWVQDEEYAMGLASFSGGGTWWMETSAEVATFLIEAAVEPHNARLYGHSSTRPSTSASSSPPSGPAPSSTRTPNAC